MPAERTRCVFEIMSGCSLIILAEWPLLLSPGRYRLWRQQNPSFGFDAGVTTSCQMLAAVSLRKRAKNHGPFSSFSLWKSKNSANFTHRETLIHSRFPAGPSRPEHFQSPERLKMEGSRNPCFRLPAELGPGWPRNQRFFRRFHRSPRARRSRGRRTAPRSPSTPSPGCRSARPRCGPRGRA